MSLECGDSEDTLLECIKSNDFYWTVAGNDSLKELPGFILSVSCT